MVKQSQQRILVISHDKIGSSMAGPGIRYHYMAEVLSEQFDVTVGFFDPTYLPDEEFERSYAVCSIDSNAFENDFNDFDTIISMYLTLPMLEFCRKHDIFMAFDIYAPVPVENLALKFYSGEPVKPEESYAYNQSNAMYAKFFAYGDLFLVSNQRQKDFWIGNIFGSGQIHLATYEKRQVLDRFIYAPMGVDTSIRLSHTKNVMRGIMPGITDKTKILLWTGGIWNWFDAQVLIKAMKQLEKSRPDIVLVFFGSKHPNPSIPAMRESTEAHQLAAELGLLGKTVFMNEGWVPYEQRINYLLEADVAVNTTLDTFENEFSHRTRVVDHILAGLPTIATKGDYLSDTAIELKRLGVTVPAGNVDAVVEAIEAVLKPENYAVYKKNLSAVRSEYDWHATLAPLLNVLSQNPGKLPYLITKKVKSGSVKNSLIRRAARRFVPAKIKQMIIRALRYGD